MTPSPTRNGLPAGCPGIPASEPVTASAWNATGRPSLLDGTRGIGQLLFPAKDRLPRQRFRAPLV